MSRRILVALLSALAIIGLTAAVTTNTPITGVQGGSGSVAITSLATQATNTVIGNATSGTASPTALAVGSCSTAGSALNWTTNTGFACNTAIAANTATTATNQSGGTISATTMAATGALTFTSSGVGGATTNWIGSDGGGGIAVNVPTGFNFSVLINNAITALGVNANGITVTGSVAPTTGYKVNTTLVISATAPTISSGFGGAASIASSIGSATFRVLTSGTTGSTGVLTMPTAATGWNCTANLLWTSGILNSWEQVSSTTTSVTFQNVTLSTGLALTTISAQTIVMHCLAY